MSQEVEYYRPASVDRACELLADNPSAVVLAGGQSLGLLSKEGIFEPEVIVDINEIESLRGLDRTNGQLHLGSLTSHRTVETSSTVAEAVPNLQESAASIADVQIRNAGTIGGVCAFADPTADYPPVLLAAGATVVAQSVGEVVEYPVRSGFFTGYYESALEENQLITEVQVPTADQHTGTAFEKLAFRKNDRAVVNVAAVVEFDGSTCEDATVAVGAASNRPILAEAAGEGLIGTELQEDDLAEAARRAKEEVEVSPDPMISEEYRSAMVENLTKSALETARGRAAA